MNDEDKRAVQRAIEALKNAGRILEEIGDGSINRPCCASNGTTMWFRCGCGQPVQYGDRYCRMCGGRIKW